MTRLITVTVKEDKAEQVSEMLRSMDGVNGLTEIDAKDGLVVMTFKCSEKASNFIIADLVEEGVGLSFGTIDVMCLQTTRPLVIHKKKKKRQYSVSDRLSVEEIFENVDSQSHLTFDFLMMTVVASVIAAAGLFSDSSVTVVASMLVSPLMGPIMSVTFGLAIGHKKIIHRGLYNELLGFLICYMVGVISALACAWYWVGLDDQPSLTMEQITSRGSYINLFTAAFVAFPSGIGVALGMTGGGINALVGVAISAALLPPVVNAGLTLIMGIWYYADGNNDEGLTQLRYSWVSTILYLENFILIVIAALGTFKLKQVTHLESRDPLWKTVSLNLQNIAAQGRAMREANGDDHAAGGVTLVDENGKVKVRKDSSENGKKYYEEPLMEIQEDQDMDVGATGHKTSNYMLHD